MAHQILSTSSKTSIRIKTDCCASAALRLSHHSHHHKTFILLQNKHYQHSILAPPHTTHRNILHPSSPPPVPNTPHQWLGDHLTSTHRRHAVCLSAIVNRRFSRLFILSVVFFSATKQWRSSWKHVRPVRHSIQISIYDNTPQSTSSWLYVTHW